MELGECWDERAIKVFDRHPQLGQDSSVWQKYLDYQSDFGMQIFGLHLGKFFIAGHQPSDTQLIRGLCRNYGHLIAHTNQLSHSDFFRELIIKDPQLVYELKRNFIEANEDFFRNSLFAEKTDPDLRADALSYKIPEHIYEDEGFADAWLRKGLLLNFSLAREPKQNSALRGARG